MASRSNARIFRFGAFALILICCGYILSRGSTYTVANTNNTTTSKASGFGSSGSVSSGQVKKPKSFEKPAPIPGDKIKATFISLARNSDLGPLLDSIRQIEDRFNHAYQYDWTFLNDGDFSEEFKEATSRLVSGKAQYGKIPQEHWSFPDWIDTKKAADTRKKMQDDGVIYGGSISYRHMCRFESGFFWRHPLLDDYEYYWRVEPDIKIYCDVDYDVFKWMKDNNKKYSFTITLPEYQATIPTLWDETKKFIKANDQYLAKNNLLEWISNDKGETYNGCHFWSNFEIASLDFWRSDAYKAYFEHLDKAGGFFYERWGDAPVHSIAAALFLPRDQVHFFGDIGYFHNPFHNCPVDKHTRLKKKCVCDPSKDFTWKDYSCTEEFHTIQGLPKPLGWEAFAG